MKQAYLYIIFIAVLLLNLALIFKIDLLKKESKNLIKTQSTTLATYLELYYDQLIQEQFNNKAKINDSVIAKDEFNNSQPISKLFGASPKLVIKFSELGCDLCIENELEIIREYTDKIGIGNIIVLTDYSNARKLQNFKLTKNIGFQVFMCDELGLPFEKENRLFMFVCDSSLFVYNFFIPEKKLPELSKYYYSAISKKYFLVNDLEE